MVPLDTIFIFLQKDLAISGLEFGRRCAGRRFYGRRFHVMVTKSCDWVQLPFKSGSHLSGQV